MCLVILWVPIESISSHHSGMAVRKRLPCRCCFALQANSFPQVRICLLTVANMLQRQLLRQMVEIEYLAWAVETRGGDGERWLRSDQQQRQSFCTPVKLRKAAQGRFRGKDYGYHCELGGHPVPRAG